MGRNPLFRTFILFLGLASALILTGVPRRAFANADLDRKYVLQSVGALRAWDNVDGLFASYVADAYRDYFLHQSRFIYQDISKANDLLVNSKIPYNKVIEDPDVLGQLARSTHCQSLIRTRVQKEGPQYRFDIEWLHSPDMEVMSHESFVLNEPGDGHGFGSEELKTKLEMALDKAIYDVPFLGTVTGRDNSSVTLDIGTLSGVQRGDTLRIGTIEEVKRHPLLKEIVEWRLADTGKVKIVEADDRMSFGKVVEEEPQHQILRDQKVVEVIHAPAQPVILKEKNDNESEHSVLNDPPHLGWVSGGINLGSFSRQYSSLDNSIGKDGGGFAFGFKADSQLWITREWFGELGLNFSSFSYSQHDTVPAGTTSTDTSYGSGSLLGFKIAGGYSYLVTGDLFGPKGWLKLGYRSNSYSLPSSSSGQLTSITFHSLFAGIGADVPVRGGFGATVDFSLGILNGASESSSLSGDTTSVSDVAFSLGGYYRYAQRITFKLSVDGQFDSADFTSQRSLSQKTITVVPAILYYF